MRCSPKTRATRWLDGFEIQRHELTMRAYRTFLLDLLEAGTPCRHGDRWKAPWPADSRCPRRAATVVRAAAR